LNDSTLVVMATAVKQSDSGDATTTNGRTLVYFPRGSGTEAQTMLPAGSSIADILSRSRQLWFVKPCRRRRVAFGQRLQFGGGERLETLNAFIRL
jgi:hypothetical protein